MPFFLSRIYKKALKVRFLFKYKKKKEAFLKKAKEILFQKEFKTKNEINAVLLSLIFSFKLSITLFSLFSLHFNLILPFDLNNFFSIKPIVFYLLFV